MINKFFMHTFIALGFWCSVNLSAAETDVFVSGEGGYHTYRIPAAVVSPKGTVLAFCEGRKKSRSDTGDIDLVLRRSNDGGKTWNAMQTVWDDAGHTCGNPCPVVDRETGVIWLLMTWNAGQVHESKIQPGFGEDSRRVFVTHSKDDGLSWAEPQEITRTTKRAEWTWYATGPGAGIQLQRGKNKGRLVIPCDHKQPEGKNLRFVSHVIYSEDHGASWQLGGITPEDQVNECEVVERSDGSLILNMRNYDRSVKARQLCFSDDGGQTWKDQRHDPALIEPVCQASIRRLRWPKGDQPGVMLFANPASEKGRVNMTVRASYDDGKTWPESRVLHKGSSAYSCICIFDDTRFGCLYEKDGYQRIAFARMDLKTLAAKVKKPNVLFLAVDDMKDWVNCLGGYEGTVHTPHIDRLAKRGMLFTNAHCPSPKCAPSRAAIMTGLMPSTTGLYDNGHWWLPNLPDVVTLPAHFKNNGYRVAGAGKIFHHTAGNHPPNQWDDFQRLVFKDDPWFRGVKLNYPWSKHGPYPKDFPFSGVKGLGHENDWGSLDMPEAEYDDTLSADYAIRFLHEEHETPFFLACGLFRPHLPWYVPQKYVDLYPLDQVVLPAIKDDDLDDLPKEGLAFAKARRGDLTTILKADKHKEAVRAYLASISYADAQLGRVLDALEASPQAADTIVVLWSDHGWHLGEKQHWHKTTLWEEATRIPFIITAPGLPPGSCSKPVSLIDLYPTLNELCGLPAFKNHDGQSLRPLLNDPQLKWHRPARIEFKQGNAAVRSERYRYIRYRNDGEELYDLKTDPNEWNNLAADPTRSALKAELAKSLPKFWANPKPTKGSFTFDHEAFTWTNKKSSKVVKGK